MDRLAAERGVVALTGIDTRSLVLHLRERGAMRGAVVDGRARRRGGARAPCGAAVDGGRGARRGASRRTSRTLRAKRATCASRSSTTAASARSCGGSPAPAPRSTVFPHDVDADTLAGYDGVLLSNGPGDPEPLADEIATVRELLGRTPVLGICLGHQLLALATGLETFKLPFGHRGANHPVLERRDRPRARDDARTTASRSRRATARA